MPVDIHGKQYITVAERVQALHETIKDKTISITTEFLPIDDMVVCKASVRIGDNFFTGTSAANPSKTIEKQSPYEVAETSAVGRALGFAGFGIVEGIASADEMVKAGADTYTDTRVQEATGGVIYATDNQIYALNQMVKHGQIKEYDRNLTKQQASDLISSVRG
jgi:hypothetical protein